VSTKTNLTIDRFGPSVPIDLNGDGQNDFAFTYLSFGFAPSLTCTSARAPRHMGKHAAPPLGCGNFNFGLQLRPLQNNNEVWQMAGLEGGHICASDVRRGVTIGPARPFGAGSVALSGLYGSSEGIPFCPWQPENPSHHPYVGVKFLDKEGKVHYGWIRVVTKLDYSPVIDAYAYETIPNKPIPAGAMQSDDDEATAAPAQQQQLPASLGWLAAGASGLVAWRREDVTS
ncbi:MAG TPA: hypothetical protein VND65_19825, partial [Candidatus Binatia bacterium]|nr:hypothetical protein [Candidatus Binatia bacterium]